MTSRDYSLLNDHAQKIGGDLAINRYAKPPLVHMRHGNKAAVCAGTWFTWENAYDADSVLPCRRCLKIAERAAREAHPWNAIPQKPAPLAQLRELYQACEGKGEPLL